MPAKTNQPISGQPRVAILIETSTSWGRRAIEGIFSYARGHGIWRFTVEPKGINEPEQIPAGWSGDGIIARVRTKELARQLKRLQIPVVNISGVLVPNAPFPRVLTDERLIANAALEHLTARGFKHFGYSGVAQQRYIAPRAHIFQETVQAAGFDCSVHLQRPGAKSGVDIMAEQQNRAEWLRSLPKPVAVAAWGAIEARSIADAALMAGLHVPEEVAIIGVDTDDLIGEQIQPALSGVQLSTEQTGYEAASILHKMMQGHDVPPVTYIPPTGIAERQSTNVMAIDEPELRNALQFIRQNAHRPLDVEEVLRHVSVSRRVLERRFREILQRSPAQEIRRVHIERAKQLLAHTNLPIPKVAAASGFNYVEHMIPLFRRMVGSTPLAYRRQIQPR